MTGHADAPARRVARLVGDEAGVSLVELVVGMSVLSAVMAMFTVGILQVYRSVNKGVSLSTAQSQLHVTFLRLDKEIRYATGISEPGVGGDGAWYVEYLTRNGTGAENCVELRLDPAGRLTRRTWPKEPNDSSPTSWQQWPPLVTDVGPVDGGAPFSRLENDIDGRSGFQRLRVRLEARSGSADTATSTQLDATFTALNAPLNAAADPAACVVARAQR